MEAIKPGDDVLLCYKDNRKPKKALVLKIKETKAMLWVYGSSIEQTQYYPITRLKSIMNEEHKNRMG